MPKIDVLVSRHDSAATRARMLAANYTVASAVVAQIARPAAGRQHAERDGEPDRARRALRRSRQRARLADREGAAIRPHAHQRRVRHLQRSNSNPVLTYNKAFIPNGSLAGADQRAAVAVREVQRVDRFLTRGRSGRSGR